MKKLIMILMAAGSMTVMSCGDGRNSARETDNDDLDNTELAEPDTTTMESDTTSMNDMDRESDDVNMQRGASDESDSESRNQRDSIQ